jgi:hypothetical protein
VSLVKVRIAQTELTIYVHVKRGIKCAKDDLLTVGGFVLDPWSMYWRLFVYVQVDETVQCSAFCLFEYCVCV